MKSKLLYLIALASFAVAVPTLQTGCSTPQNERVAAVNTLKAVGQSAEGAVGLSAQLYRDGKITAEQARDIADFYNLKFIPAFKLAVSAAHSDLSSFASADILALSLELSNLVIQFQNK